MGRTGDAVHGTRTALLVGDVLALVAFVLVGVAEHDGRITAGLVLRTAGPLLIGWFALTAVLGTYRSPGLRTLLTTWIATVPMAVVVRSIIAGGPWGVRLMVFLGVALAFTLLFLLAGRAATGALARSRPPVRQ
ncbi:MAG TPA: DUF3054 domain-containing protein [Actinomycetota bacterium]